jgi:hypothetical protein
MFAGNAGMSNPQVLAFRLTFISSRLILLKENGSPLYGWPVTMKTIKMQIWRDIFGQRAPWTSLKTLWQICYPFSVRGVFIALDHSDDA